MALPAPAPSTQNLVAIQEIRDGVLVLKDGSMRTVIDVSSINFELRSEDEQIAITQNFQNFINSLNFPIQISVVSRQLYVEDYLKFATEATSQLDNELLRIQASEYMKFIKELATLSNIMSKKFYVIVPFYIFETPTKTGFFQSFKSTVNPAAATKGLTTEKFETYKNQLMQRVELVFGGLAGLGLKSQILEKEELTKLFYGFYNPPAARTLEEKTNV